MKSLKNVTESDTTRVSAASNTATQPSDSAAAPSDQDPIVVFQRRADLQLQRGKASGKTVWTIKDPLSLNYFQVGSSEYALLLQLDGRPRRLSEIVACVKQQFPDEELSVGNAIQFLHQLLATGLIRVNASGQGDRINRIRTRKRRQERIHGALRILSTRFPGINPRPLLKFLEPATRYLFKPLTLVVFAMILLSALALVTLRFSEVVQRLPTLHHLIAPQNVMWVMLAIVIVKLFHELGHAVVCNHLKADCHEFGIMLLVLFPVFYCNVSDSWTLQPWKRVAIAGAGIATELLIASICTLLWWFSSPGPLNAFLLNLMLVCSIGTIVFNANPLLKFDGYFILQDVLNIPNLGQQARSVVQRSFDLTVFGTSVDEPVDVPDSAWWLLLTYGLASLVYRLLISVFILLFLWQVFRSWNLEVLFSILSIPMLMGVVVIPSVGFSNRLRRTMKTSDPQEKSRAKIGFAVFAAGVMALLLIPFPCSVRAPCVIEPRDSDAVYVVVPGHIRSAAPLWEPVTRGDVIAELTNPDVELEFVRLSERVNELRLQLTNLERRRSQDASIAFVLPAAQTALVSARERLERVRLERSRLRITSPTDGMVLPPPNRVTGPGVNWSGRPTDARNQGAFLDAATMLCSIGDADSVEALVVVSQESIQQVAIGQTVEVQLLSTPSSTIQGRVTAVARSNESDIPREIVSAGLLAAEPAKGGSAVNYQVRVTLESPAIPVGIYSPGWARIRSHPMALSTRLLRSIRQAFAGGR